MLNIDQQEVAKYIERSISQFHQNRINDLKNLKLQSILELKNPYLFKAKSITTASNFVKCLLDTHLFSVEEMLFREFLEELAVFICSRTFGGWKSSAEGIDLEFEEKDIRYLVSIELESNWGNSSQLETMLNDFSKVKRRMRAKAFEMKVVAVNGCCYGKDDHPEKGDYLKLCGQRFWEFISGSESLYADIIEPIGHLAKENNDQFEQEYRKVINRFTGEFIQSFCDAEGEIIWQKLVQLNSAKKG